MRRALSALATVALAVPLLATPAHAGDIPAEFGADWDDPISPVSIIQKPETKNCEIVVVDKTFFDDAPENGSIELPEDCGDEWSAIVLRLDGKSQGNQDPKHGTFTIGVVPVFQTSTPVPSTEGISWTTERDISSYAALFHQKQSTSMLLRGFEKTPSNGVDLEITLTFYSVDSKYPAINSPNKVLALSSPVDSDTGTSVHGSLTVPRNSERLIADVYASAFGDSCEQEWYRTAAIGSGYRCEAEHGPYREIQILIDGEVAGIATPYPHMYADGWSNPYLWSTLPAPRALNMSPLRIELTPYLGVLNDGTSHEVEIRIVGAPENTDAWTTPVAFRVWQDTASSIVSGGTITSQVSNLTNDLSVLHSDGHANVSIDSGRTHVATGWLETSHGSVLTTVERTVGVRSIHDFNVEVSADLLDAEWIDIEKRTVFSDEATSDTRHYDRTYRISGQTGTDESGRIIHRVELADVSSTQHTNKVGNTTVTNRNDEYFGVATFHPDAKRQPVGVSHFQSEISGDNVVCHDRSIYTRNGLTMTDIQGCE